MYIYYLILINLWAFVAYAVDKKKAIEGKYRIPERTLIILALLGGGIGSLSSMYIFHHKTRKPKFYIGVPLILIVETVAFVYIRLKM